MKAYLKKTPVLLKTLWPDFLWSVPSKKKTLYLTFDDGPHPEITTWVLDELKKYQAKATFFCVGDNIQKYHVTFSKIITSGHRVGNHTYNHLNGWKTKTDIYLKNIEQTAALITQNSKLKTQNPKQQTRNNIHETRLFRPPYGKIRPKTAKTLIQQGYQIVMWDVLSGDFDRSIPEETCLEIVLQYSEPGSIVVFHDSKKAFKNLKYSLPKVLDYFTGKGYTFEALP